MCIIILEALMADTMTMTRHDTMLAVSTLVPIIFNVVTSGGPNHPFFIMTKAPLLVPHQVALFFLTISKKGSFHADTL